MTAFGLGLAHTRQRRVDRLAPAPLSKRPVGVVKPNLMFVLDTSGAWIGTSCRTALGDGLTPRTKDLARCHSARLVDFSDRRRTNTRHRALNGIYYNPAIIYTPAVNYDGTSRRVTPPGQRCRTTPMESRFTGTTDLTNAYPDTCGATDDSGSASIRRIAPRRSPRRIASTGSGPAASGRIRTAPSDTRKLRACDATNPLAPFITPSPA